MSRTARQIDQAEILARLDRVFRSVDRLSDRLDALVSQLTQVVALLAAGMEHDAREEAAEQSWEGRTTANFDVNDFVDH
jgi:hypothetical protein